MTNCKDTTIQIPYSRQLRIHDCIHVNFIIHVASGPIIEGCKGMMFYQKDYRQEYGIDVVHNFNPGMNLYWDVKDFNWLKNNVKSPNFDVVTEDGFREDKSIHDVLSCFSKSITINTDDTATTKNANDCGTDSAPVIQDCEDPESSDDEL